MGNSINTGSTPYDDVFRTLVVDHKGLLLSLINEMFPDIGDYTGDEEVTPLSEIYEMNRQDGEQDKRITDSAIVVTDHAGNRKTFHLECQSTDDGSIIIRMFEYDMQIALKSVGSYTPGELRVDMPKSGILFLRCSDSTPDEMLVRMTLPDGNEVSYTVPVLKLRRYDIDSIFKKHLYFLVPFYLFNLESSFNAVESNDEGRKKQFRETVRNLRDRLEKDYHGGYIDAYTYRAIVDLFRKVSTALTRGRELVFAETEAIMGGQVLEYEAKTILNKGKAEGKAEGMAEGIAEGIAKGKAEGIAEGIAEGKNEERAVNIKIFISDKKEDGVPNDIIAAKLKKYYNLSEEEIKDLL